MNKYIESQKPGTDKIVFLGIFILSLLIAYLIVYANSGILFSDPIELPYSGLSVSIPFNKGWESDLKWQYQDNSYNLRSRFLPDAGIPAAAVNCSYFAPLRSVDSMSWFELQAAGLNSSIEQTGQIRKDNLVIEWARIDTPVFVFLGTAQLPNNRRINIEVFQTTFEIDVAEKVFMEIVDSLEFNEDNALQTGVKIISEIQYQGFESLVDETKEACFFINNAKNDKVGFSIDLFEHSEDSGRVNIQAASHLYLKGSNAQEQKALFEGDNNLSKFIWQSRTNQINGQFETKIILEEPGKLNVIRQIGTESEESEQIVFSEIIPSIFLESLIYHAVRSNVSEAIIDVLDSDGKITPTYFSFEPLEEQTEDDFYVVKLEFLDGRNFEESLYLNEQKEITRALIQQNVRYNLERTDIQQIINEFPERADAIPKTQDFSVESTL